MLRRHVHSKGVAGQNNRLLSAKSRWEIRTPLQQDVIPCTCCDSISFWSRADNPFEQNRNKYSDSGSPCLMPRVGEKTDFVKENTKGITNFTT